MQTVPPKALTAFFSYSSDTERFVTDILERTQFRKIIGCKVVNDKNISFGSRVEQITKLIDDADLFIAFISGGYSSDPDQFRQLDKAIQSLVNGGSFTKLQEVAFVVLDADGETWWARRKTQSDITSWRSDPVDLNCANALGTGPDDVASAEMTSKIESMATQIRQALDAKREPTKNPDSAIPIGRSFCSAIR